MARDFQRSRRIEQQIQRLLTDAIQRQVRDPRVHGVIITDVRVARDLSNASVFYSGLVADGDVANAQAGLEHAAGFLRTVLAQGLSSRTVPALRFCRDGLVAYGRHMDDLIDQAMENSSAAPMGSADDDVPEPR